MSQWHNWLTMKAQSLEWTILKAIARVRPDEWLPCSLGDLRLRMRDIEADALNASMNSIVEACIFLLENGYILLGKREAGGKRLPSVSLCPDRRPGTEGQSLRVRPPDTGDNAARDNVLPFARQLHPPRARSVGSYHHAPFRERQDEVLAFHRRGFGSVANARCSG